MEVRLAATTSTAGDDAVVRILIAIELSKKSWIVGANTPLKAKTSQFQLAVGDWKALLELIERLRVRQLCRHRAESLVQWVDRARPGHQQVRQFHGPYDRDRTGLDVAAVSARQCPEHLVP